MSVAMAKLRWHDCARRERGVRILKVDCEMLVADAGRLTLADALPLGMSRSVELHCRCDFR